MSADRLAELVEGYLAGSLGPAETEELRALVTRDGEARREFTGQVRLARALETLLGEPDDDRVWSRIAVQLDGAPGNVGGLIAAVDHRIDRRGRKARTHLILGVAAVALIVVAGVVWRALPSARPPARELVRTEPRPPQVEERPATPSPAPPAAVRWQVSDDVVFRLDPDRLRRDGVKLRYGRPARCPPGAGVRRCIQTERQRGTYTSQGTLSVGGPPGGLFPYADDALLVFDYWLGETIGARDTRLTSWYKVTGRRPGYEYRQREPARRGGWERAVFPLSEYFLQSGAIRPTDGERVPSFNISCPVAQEDVFFIANLRVVRGRRL